VVISGIFIFKAPNFPLFFFVSFFSPYCGYNVAILIRMEEKFIRTRGRAGVHPARGCKRLRSDSQHLLRICFLLLVGLCAGVGSTQARESVRPPNHDRSLAPAPVNSVGEKQKLRSSSPERLIGKCYCMQMCTQSCLCVSDRCKCGWNSSLSYTNTSVQFVQKLTTTHLFNLCKTTHLFSLCGHIRWMID